MAYVETKFAARFAARVLSNLTTLLERDTEAALTELNDTLQLFKDFRTPTPIALNFPALFVTVESVVPDQSADDSYITQTQRFGVDVAIVGKDGFTLQQAITLYVLAIDRVIRTASPADLVGELTAFVGKPAWEVTAHDYLLSKSETSLRADARLIVTIQFLER